MADVPFPRGVRDLMPNQALFRNELLSKIEKIYQRYGFLTIDTPTFESMKILKAKNAIGEDTKLLFELDNGELGLRYDMTVSLARYVAMHSDIPQPFKRYYIGKAWRREEPQKLRYREFTQADVDIIGGDRAPADAEILAVGAAALESIGMDYYVQINDRRFIDSVLESFGVKKDLFIEVIRIVDKLEKLGEDQIVALLKKLGLDNETVARISKFVNFLGGNEEKLTYLEGILKDKSPVQEMRQVLQMLELYKPKGEVEVEFSLMRGFDYYTGIVFEFKSTDPKVRSTIAAGGRYDNLIGLYSGKTIPAVGVSLGIDRLLDLMNFSESQKYTYADVFVAYIKDKNYPYALKVANSFRSNGIPTDLNLAKRNISNQLSYANSLRYKYVAIIGDEEEQQKKVKLRNLIDGEEQILGISDAADLIRRR